MKSTRPAQLSAIHKLLLGAILVAAAAVRLWGLTSYFPQFWDEALYLSEAEGIIPLFSVNVGAFALLKLGRVVFGLPAYPQIVCAIFGILAVIGCYALGCRLLRDRDRSIALGLLMAAQAALLPYCVRYSRHALAEGFALCFFVWALWLYLGQSALPRVKNKVQQKQYVLRGLAATAALALVPACSFKFLLPTIILFLVLELFNWRMRQQQRDFRSGQSLLISLAAGAAAFISLPFLLAAVSGYSGWLDRAIELSSFHASMGTLQPAFHFLLPEHLWYLGGPVFVLYCLAGGLVLLFGQRFLKTRFAPGREILIPALSFAVYFLFFGALSHLQSARLYVLTLPFLFFVAAVPVLTLRQLVPRAGRVVAAVVGLVLIISAGALTVNYVQSYASLQPVCDDLMQRWHDTKKIYANAKAQVFYGCFHSPQTGKGTIHVDSYIYADRLALEMANPPLLVIEDGVDLVSTIASQDKMSGLAPVDSVGARLRDYRVLEQCSDRIAAAATGFYSSPHYYLEDLYSRQSLAYIRTLLPRARDSIYVYIFNPDKARAMGSRPHDPVIE